MASADYDSMEDLTQLCGPFTEDVIVKALQQRYAFGKRHTHLGPLLLSVNTLSSSHGIRALVDTGQPEAPVDALAASLVQQLRLTGVNQCLALHGISGSGKTFQLHRLLRQVFLATSPSATAGCSVSEASAPQLQLQTDAFKHASAAITVLQPLTCAATGQNPDSSRVSLHIEAQLAESSVYHCRLNCLLFDQSRLCNPPPGERNFHIFYQLMAGLTGDEKEKLHLAGHTPQTLRYLNSCTPEQRETEWNEMRYNTWKLALAQLGIPVSDIARILAAILLLGNVGFVEAEESAAAAQLEVVGHRDLKAAASLLGVSGPALYSALTQRSVGHHQTSATSVVITDAVTASKSRDSLVRELYTHTLRILVRRFNTFKRPESRSTASSSDSSSDVSAGHHASDSGSLHLLDLGGFEATQRSRFDQLAANIAAEQTQRWYERCALQEVAEAASLEGLAPPLGSQVPTQDNSDLMQLLLHPRSGIAALLNCHSLPNRTGHATSSGDFLDTLKELHAVNDHLFQPSSPDRRSCFGIRHTVTRVLYDSADFAEANAARQLPDSACAIFQAKTCSFAFACYLFRGRNAAASRAAATAGATDRGQTLLDQTRAFLHACETAVAQCERTFVLCLKPNFACEPLVFDRNCVAQQVRALGLASVLSLLSCGFSQRLSFSAFEHRAAFLLRSTSLNPRAIGKERCRALVNAFLHSAELHSLPYRDCKCAFGTESVFINEDFRQHLKALRVATAAAAAATTTTVNSGRKSRPELPAAAATPSAEVATTLDRKQKKSPGHHQKQQQQQRQHRLQDSSQKSHSLSDLRQLCQSYARPPVRLFRKVPDPPERRSSAVSPGPAAAAPAGSLVVSASPQFAQRHAVRSRSRTPEARRRAPFGGTTSSSTSPSCTSRQTLIMSGIQV